jgi:hypothetical protein
LSRKLPPKLRHQGRGRRDSCGMQSNKKPRHGAVSGVLRDLELVGGRLSNYRRKPAWLCGFVEFGSLSYRQSYCLVRGSGAPHLCDSRATIRSLNSWRVRNAPVGFCNPKQTSFRVACSCATRWPRSTQSCAFVLTCSNCLSSGCWHLRRLVWCSLCAPYKEPTCATTPSKVGFPDSYIRSVLCQHQTWQGICRCKLYSDRRRGEHIK